MGWVLGGRGRWGGGGGIRERPPDVECWFVRICDLQTLPGSRYLGTMVTYDASSHVAWMR